MFYKCVSGHSLLIIKSNNQRFAEKNTIIEYTIEKHMTKCNDI